MSGDVIVKTSGTSSAVFSPCGKYRYRLSRCWNPDTMPACFIMLNPSTADEMKNDPTVERCEQRSRAMGHGGLIVANIFALRSTDPKALYSAPDPVGPDNDEAIIAAAEAAAVVICGWGAHGAFGERGKTVLALLYANSIKPHALKLNADGAPAHPLYLSYRLAPFAL